MAWEWLEKYLKGGLRTQGVPDVIGGEVPTRGLFGTGGEYGTGGLLTTFNQPSDPGKGMLDLFSNLPVVTGMEILQGGMTGKPIEQTLLPAFKTSLRTTAAVEKVKASKRKQKYIKEYKDQVPEKDMELFLAFPEKYVSAMLIERVKTPTLSKEAWALYTEAKKHGSGDDFKEWFKTLPKADQDLYNKQIRPVRGRLEAILSAGIDVREKLKEIRDPTDAELKKLEDANPGKSKEFLIKWFRDNWESISADL